MKPGGGALSKARVKLAAAPPYLDGEVERGGGELEVLAVAGDDGVADGAELYLAEISFGVMIDRVVYRVEALHGLHDALPGPQLGLAAIVAAPAPAALARAGWTVVTPPAPSPLMLLRESLPSRRRALAAARSPCPTIPTSVPIPLTNAPRAAAAAAAIIVPRA